MASDTTSAAPIPRQGSDAPAVRSPAIPGVPPSRWDCLPRDPRGCLVDRLQVPTEKIGIVNAILEGYDFIARVRTDDIARGVLVVVVPLDWVDVYEGAVNQMAGTLPLKRLGPPAPETGHT